MSQGLISWGGSIGGPPLDSHDFNKFQIDVLRKGQEMLQLRFFGFKWSMSKDIYIYIGYGPLPVTVESEG